ncbi:MAG: carbohydrate ABC transporter permease [Nitrososphaeria archaeon]|nr:carbohydrate ABC transporter permease [Nitrososphaeria archaeon]
MANKLFKHYAYKIMIYFLVIVILLYMVGPFVYMIFASLYDKRSFWTWPPKWPDEITISAYDWIFKYTNFTTYYINSLLVAFVSMIINLFISSLAGYGLARFKWRLNDLIMKIIIFTYIFPFFGLIIPIFRLFYNLGLYDSLFGLSILYAIFNMPFNIIILSGFFQMFPKEIEEAAKVDGASNIMTFLKIVMPNIVPGIITAALFHYIWCWGEYYFAAILISKDALRTLPPALYSLMRGETVFYRELLAAASMVAFPALIITLLTQKFLIKGLTAGAIKG